MRVAVLIPTYNEVKNISLLLASIDQVAECLENVNFLVYVIDDSSPDGTGSAVLAFQNSIKAKNLEVNLLPRQKKEGLGKAYIYGFNVVSKLENPPHYILQMDSDLSHNPIYIYDFVAAAKMGADFIVGSRYIEGGSSPDWSWYRKALSVGGNTFSKAMLGSELTDYTGGFNMFSLELIKRMNLDSVNSLGYGFLIQLKFMALQSKKKLVQVPIKFLDREHGISKMPLNTVLKNFLLVLKLGLSRWI